VFKWRCWSRAPFFVGLVCDRIACSVVIFGGWCAGNQCLWSPPRRGVEPRRFDACSGWVGWRCGPCISSGATFCWLVSGGHNLVLIQGGAGGVVTSVAVGACQVAVSVVPLGRVGVLKAW